MKLKIILPNIIYALALIVAAVMPSGAAYNNKKIELPFVLRLDYLIHCFAYMGFYFLVILINLARKGAYPAKYYLHLFIATLVLAVGTEFIQLFLSYRTFNPFDILANFTGAALGMIILFICSKYQRKSFLY